MSRSVYVLLWTAPSIGRTLKTGCVRKREIRLSGDAQTFQTGFGVDAFTGIGIGSATVNLVNWTMRFETSRGLDGCSGLTRRQASDPLDN